MFSNARTASKHFDHQSALTKTIEIGQNTENILALHVKWKKRELKRLPDQAYENLLWEKVVITSFRVIHLD